MTVNYVPTTEQVRNNMALGATAVGVGAIPEALAKDINWPAPGLRDSAKEQFDAWLDDYTHLITAPLVEALAEVREYVDHPGNWGTYDGRRQTILGLLDGDPKAQWWKDWEARR